jgi:predicted metal-dependent phosphotriesterase family hydrolase
MIEHAIPYMRVYGYTEKQIHQLTRNNPACMITGDDPSINLQP